MLAFAGKHSDKPWELAIGVAMVVGETDEIPAVAVVHDTHPSESSRPDGTVTFAAEAPCCDSVDKPHERAGGRTILQRFQKANRNFIGV